MTRYGNQSIFYITYHWATPVCHGLSSSLANRSSPSLFTVSDYYVGRLCGEGNRKFWPL